MCIMEIKCTQYYMDIILGLSTSSSMFAKKVAHNFSKRLLRKVKSFRNESCASFSKAVPKKQINKHFVFPNVVH